MVKSNSILHELYQYKDRELFNLIAIRSGGKTTIRIIDEILIKPKNTNQIAKTLGLDYKTVQHHLDIICNHDYLIKEKFNETSSFFPSDKLIKSLDEYNNIKNSLKNE